MRSIFLTVHEPSSIRGDVSFLYREVQIRENLYGFQKYSVFSSAIHLHIATKKEGENIISPILHAIDLCIFGVSMRLTLTRVVVAQTALSTTTLRGSEKASQPKTFRNRNLKRRKNKVRILEKY